MVRRFIKHPDPGGDLAERQGGQALYVSHPPCGVQNPAPSCRTAIGYPSARSSPTSSGKSQIGTVGVKEQDELKFPLEQESPLMPHVIPVDRTGPGQ